jgi:hypothetical protein
MFSEGDPSIGNSLAARAICTAHPALDYRATYHYLEAEFHDAAPARSILRLMDLPIERLADLIAPHAARFGPHGAISPMTPAEFRDLRLRLGVSQRVLGELLGIGHNEVSHKERGTRPITVCQATALRALAADRHPRNEQTAGWMNVTRGTSAPSNPTDPSEEEPQ